MCVINGWGLHVFCSNPDWEFMAAIVSSIFTVAAVIVALWLAWWQRATVEDTERRNAREIARRNLEYACSIADYAHFVYAGVEANIREVGLVGVDNLTLEIFIQSNEAVQQLKTEAMPSGKSVVALLRFKLHLDVAKTSIYTIISEKKLGYAIAPNHTSQRAAAAIRSLKSAIKANDSLLRELNEELKNHS